MRLIDADALIENCRSAYCKDCKRREGLKVGKTVTRYEIGGLPCRACDTQDMVEELENAPTVDAEPVRRAKWVHVSGYCTPGGDPVWRCSECGKGVHIYGVEHGTYGRDISDGQWVACPNCGAVMDGE